MTRFVVGGSTAVVTGAAGGIGYAVAHELSSDPDRKDRPKSAAEAQARFDAYLNNLHIAAPRSGLGAATGAFIDDLVNRANRYRDHLFVCFDDPRIPGTSNEIERFFGNSKQLLRHAVGCGSTTNTVVANLGAEPLMACRQIHQPEALTALRASAPSTADFRGARSRIARDEVPGIRQRSAVRHLDPFTKRLLAEWLHPEPVEQLYA